MTIKKQESQELLYIDKQILSNESRTQFDATNSEYDQK